MKHERELPEWCLILKKLEEGIKSKRTAEEAIKKPSGRNVE
jgi:hypothetical protein